MRAEALIDGRDPTVADLQSGHRFGVPVSLLHREGSPNQSYGDDGAVAFTDANSADQLRMVGEGTLDIAIVHQQPPVTLHQRLLFEQPFGVSLRPGHPLANQETCPVRDLDDIRVLVHARGQVPAEHDRMITISNELGINPNWRFAHFSENALLCAEASEAEAVLLSEPSALRALPEWPWRKLIEPTVNLRTWAARQERTRAVVAKAMETLCRYASSWAPVRMPMDPR